MKSTTFALLVIVASFISCGSAKPSQPFMKHHHVDSSLGTGIRRVETHDAFKTRISSLGSKRDFVLDSNSDFESDFAKRDGLLENQLSSGVPVSGVVTADSSSSLFYIQVADVSQGVHIQVNATDNVILAVSEMPFGEYSGEDGTTPALKQHDFKILYGSCVEQYFILVRYAGTSPSATFTLTATAVSRSLDLDGSHVTNDFSTLSGFNVASHTYTVTPTSACTDFTIQFHSATNDYTRIRIQSACGDALLCEEANYDDLDGANYFQAKMICAAAQTYYVVIEPRFVSGGSGQYEVFAVSGDASQACSGNNACQNFGVCVGGVCKCQDPYYGATCTQLNTSVLVSLKSLQGSLKPHQTMYASVTTTSDNTGYENAVFTLSGVTGYDLYLAMNRDAPPIGNDLFWFVSPSPLPIPLIKEICNSQAIGTFIVRITNYGSTVQNFTLSQTTMDRTLTDNSQASGALSAAGNWVHYRIAAPVNPNLVITMTGDKNLNGMYLISGDDCGTHGREFKWLAADISSGGQKQAFQATTSCFSVSTDVYIVISGANAAYSLETSTKVGTCKDNCNGNGVCSAEGTCYCYQGFSGDSCTPVFNAISLNSVASGTVTNYAYYYFSFQIDATKANAFFIDQQGDADVFVGRDPRDFSEFFISTNLYDCAASPDDSGSQDASGIWYGFARPNVFSSSNNYQFEISTRNDAIVSGQSMSGTVNGNSKKFYRFSLKASQQLHVDVTANVSAVSVAINSKCTYTTSNMVDGVATANGYSLDMKTCNEGVYWLVISSNYFTTSPYTFTATISSGTLACPNCCSNSGICNSDGTCSCVQGFTGNDCSGNQCQVNANDYCGITTPTLINPQQVIGAEAYSCSLDNAVRLTDNYAMHYMMNLASGTQCGLELKKLVCSGFLLSCNSTAIKAPCPSDCDAVINACGCMADIRDTCLNFVNSYYPSGLSKIAACPASASSTTGTTTESGGVNDGSILKFSMFAMILLAVFAL